MVTNNCSLESLAFKRLDDVLKTNRYKLICHIGRGTWGRIYEAEDKYHANSQVAIKVLDPTETARKQMKERNIDAFKAMRKEAAPSTLSEKYENIVPRSFEIDHNGRPFIVTPVYYNFLSDALCYGGFADLPCSVKNGMHMWLAAKLLRGIARGLYEIHSKMKRVHGDLKPNNIALDWWYNPLINDLGTSTCATFGRTMSPRDNMGDINMRAYECFNRGSHPTTESDIYSWAAIAYRIFSGNYPWEKELMSINNPTEFFKNYGKGNIDCLIKKRVKENIPKGFRQIVQKGLSYSPFSRQHDGESLLSELEKVIEKQHYPKCALL